MTTRRTRKKEAAPRYGGIEEVFYRVAEIRYRNVPFEIGDHSITREVSVTYDSVVVDLVRRHYGDRTVEFCGAVALAPSNKVLGHCIIGQGSVDYAPVSVTEFARFVALSGAGGVITFHNHPSGRLEWSPEDRELTLRFHGVCDLLGVQYVDNLLITSDGYLSMLQTSDAALRGRPVTR